jgi:hypothetical protein
MEPMPGMACKRPVTTRRIALNCEISRSTRNMRKARSTENAPEDGISAMATMMKSKMRHGSRQKPVKLAVSRAAISATKMARHSLSMNMSTGPNRSIHQGEVSSPRVMALTTMTAMMKRSNSGLATSVASLARSMGDQVLRW